jgi:hypothetical protein
MIKYRGKTYTMLSNSDRIDKPIKFGLKVVDNDSSFTFELDGNYDENIISNSLDKAFQYMRDRHIVNQTNTCKTKGHIKYSSEKDNWEEIDAQKIIKNKTKHNKIVKK